jgi:hypothetical protein
MFVRRVAKRYCPINSKIGRIERGGGKSELLHAERSPLGDILSCPARRHGGFRLHGGGDPHHVYGEAGLHRWTEVDYGVTGERGIIAIAGSRARANPCVTRLSRFRNCENMPSIAAVDEFNYPQTRLRWRASLSCRLLNSIGCALT